MAEIEVGEQTLTIKTPDGQEYPIADPLDLMLWLEEEAPQDGKFSRDSVAKIKAKIMEVSGVPNLTASQVLKFIMGLRGFGEELKKNIGLTPSSSIGTDTAPPIQPNASASTRISPGSRPQPSSPMPSPSESPSTQTPTP